MQTLTPVHTLYSTGAIRDSKNNLVAIWDRHDGLLHLDGLEMPLPCSTEQRAMDMVAEYQFDGVGK